MSDDLIKRLRDTAVIRAADIHEAADRIVALEAENNRRAGIIHDQDAHILALEAQVARLREADPSAPIDLSQEAVDDMAWTLDHMGEPGSRPRHAAAMLRALRAAAPADPVAEAALHRSFPDVGDGRPMPPMGDELMICGLNEADARFVAVQLANHGLTLRNWRKTAINAMDLAHSDYMTGKGRDPAKYTSQFSMAATALRAIGEASHAAD